MTSTMIKVAMVWGTLSLSKKKSGTPTRAAAPKHTSCRFVRLNMTFVFILVRSLGTGTYAMKYLLSARQWACKMDFARLPVLKREKQSITV